MNIQQEVNTIFAHLAQADGMMCRLLASGALTDTEEHELTIACHSLDTIQDYVYSIRQRLEEQHGVIDGIGIAIEG
jgi:hypothetical protein